MLKIGEFSKLSHLTIKALRFYEKEGLLIPSKIDEWSGYRFYETEQLEQASRIKAFRQIGLSIEEIKSILHGKDLKDVLEKKIDYLEAQKKEIESQLSIIHYIMEVKEMKYQVIEKELKESIVYYCETTLEHYQDLMEWIPSLGAEVMKLNPAMQCASPAYEFVEYLDGEYKDHDIRIRHNEAVIAYGKENDLIHFKTIPACKVLSIYHKGAYDTIGEAYAFIMNYAKDNGYKVNGLARESYIDGIWNKESVDEWLTEIQLPVE